MINFLDLPSGINQFVQPIKLENLKHTTGHNWVYLRINDVITYQGIHWFKKYGILFFPLALIFKISKQAVGPLHNDRQEVAINFVLQGHGRMEWVKNLDATEKSASRYGLDYTLYENIKTFDVSDTWEGQVALVKVNTPHRVVTSNVERYCLSIRPYSPNTFDEAYKSLYNCVI